MDYFNFLSGMLYFMTTVSFYDFIEFYIFSSLENNQFYILYYFLLPMTVHSVSYIDEVLFNLRI